MKDFNGLVIPKEVFLNKKLCWAEKILLSLIISGHTELKNSEYGELLGVTWNRASVMLGKLKKLGFISISFVGKDTHSRKISARCQNG